MDLTAERLREVLSYSPGTGEFRWRVRASKKTHVGAVAGCRRPDGYTSIRIDKGLYLAHRLVWLYMTGKWPAEQLDHRNHARSDNRFRNLRECSQLENAANMSLHKDSVVLYKGVSFDPRRGTYSARICKDSIRVHIGTFSTAIEAAAAYDAVSEKYHGKFSSPNGV